MKIAYLDLFSGISGDMFLGACIDAGLELVELNKALSGLAVSGYKLKAHKVNKGSVSCIKLDVLTKDHSHERHYSDILKLIKQSKLSKFVKTRAAEMFTCLAHAEAKIHGTTIDKIHFHEIGALDSIIDIVGAAVAIEKLEISRLYFSAIPLSRGTIKTAHGEIPIPAPATLELIKGMQTIPVPIDAELVTPTGACILKTLGEQNLPPDKFNLVSTGYGAGKKEIPDRANFVRLLIFETCESSTSDTVFVLETNLDDVTGEEIGHLQEILFKQGALDVYTTPIYMKKSRPAIKLSIIAPTNKTARLEKLVFEHTGTFGIRRYMVERSKLAREELTVNTKYGGVRVKLGALKNKLVAVKPEFEDMRQISHRLEKPIQDVREEILSSEYMKHKKRRSNSH